MGTTNMMDYMDKFHALMHRELGMSITDVLGILVVRDMLNNINKFCPIQQRCHNVQPCI
jgi:hypothetical protein